MEADNKQAEILVRNRIGKYATKKPFKKVFPSRERA
jgi:hypothetical protein